MQGIFVPNPPKVSVVVPVRNESAGILACLTALSEQDYLRENFEVIVVDNHSTDDTLSLVRSFEELPQLKIVELGIHLAESKAFKKEALTYGILSGSGEIILTCDGDCIPLPSWISSMVSWMHAQNLDIASGPVSMQGDGFWQEYQRVEVSGLLAATGGGIYSDKLLIANGANLAFTRASFDRVQGFKDNMHLASGDDVFLMQRLVEEGFRAGFVKDKGAIVKTEALRSLRALIQQRVRWAGKSSAYQHMPSKISAMMVATANVFVVLLMLLALIFGGVFTFFFLAAILLKFVSEAPLIAFGLHFLEEKVDLPRQILSHIINPFLNTTVSILVMMDRESEWKGRKIMQR